MSPTIEHSHRTLQTELLRCDLNLTKYDHFNQALNISGRKQYFQQAESFQAVNLFDIFLFINHLTVKRFVILQGCFGVVNVILQGYYSKTITKPQLLSLQNGK